jgi:hypothetical protein
MMPVSVDTFTVLLLSLIPLVFPVAMVCDAMAELRRPAQRPAPRKPAGPRGGLIGPALARFSA